MYAHQKVRIPCLDCISYPGRECDGKHLHLGHQISAHRHSLVPALSAYCEHCGFPRIQIKGF